MGSSEQIALLAILALVALVLLRVLRRMWLGLFFLVLLGMLMWAALTQSSSG